MPSAACDWQCHIAIDDDAALLILAKREEGDSRFRIYLSGGLNGELRLLHTCGDESFGGEAGVRVPRSPSPTARAMPAVVEPSTERD